MLKTTIHSFIHSTILPYPFPYLLVHTRGNYETLPLPIEIQLLLTLPKTNSPLDVDLKPGYDRIEQGQDRTGVGQDRVRCGGIGCEVG